MSKSRKLFDSGQAIDAFHDAVREQMQAGMSRDLAILNVVRKRPSLHRAYLAQTNPENAKNILDQAEAAGL